MQEHKAVTTISNRQPFRLDGRVSGRIAETTQSQVTGEDRAAARSDREATDENCEAHAGLVGSWEESWGGGLRQRAGPEPRGTSKNIRGLFEGKKTTSGK